MKNSYQSELGNTFVLDATIASDLMTSNPVSIRSDATVSEAVALLTGKGQTAAPVIDDAGRPIGVVSRTDLLIHGKHEAEPARANGQPDQTAVRDVMTPAVFSVSWKSSAQKVVTEMVTLNVHQLYVIDDAGDLVGVINALDVLRGLRAVPEGVAGR